MNVPITLLKTALITLCFAQFAQAEKNSRDIWVFGDSLSSPYYSWVELIDDAGYARMRNTARGGLRMVDVIMPDWLICSVNEQTGARHDEVIIWLGGNDGLQQVKIDWYERKLRDHLQFLKGRGCQVYLVLPPYVEGDAELIEILEPYRTISEQISFEYDNVQLLDIPHPSKHLPDRIHQSAGLHFWQGVYMVRELGLQGPSATGAQSLSPPSSIHLGKLVDRLVFE
jgi:hypothetical protein